MSNTTRFLFFVVLDGFGTLMLVLGLADWFGDAELVPRSLQFPGYDKFLVIAGLLLALPLALHVIGRARRVRQERASGSD